jgi:exopolyphosphatase / guanosine-5'-triphosphate,3'-diphosphate pyrophosphatase
VTVVPPKGEGSERNALAVGDRIAAIDIGTNTVLLTVAERVEAGGDLGGHLRIVGERHAITRLGQGVDQTQRLDAEASRRTLACLRHYAEEMRAIGANRAVCVGTSALRDAVGGELFLRDAGAILGSVVEVVSGTREAELTFRGAISGLTDHPASLSQSVGSSSDRVLAFDIGGGSTEIAFGTTRGEVLRSVSLDIGSVRLFERHAGHTFSHAEGVLRALLPARFEETPGLVLGIAGTMTTLWSLAYGMPFDEKLAAERPLSSAEIARLARDLFAMTLAERRHELHIDEGRADVIPFGALIAAEVLRWGGAERVRVTARGVRYGLLLETSQPHENMSD